MQARLHVVCSWQLQAAVLLQIVACSSSGRPAATSNDQSAAPVEAGGEAATANTAGDTATVASAGSGSAGSTADAPAPPAAIGGNGSAAGSQSLASVAGSSAPAAAGSSGSPSAGGPSTASAGMAGAATAETFRLVTSATLLGPDEYAFPATALPPMNQSPELSWSGVPAEAKSLALVFTDVTSTAYKWVLWDIPPAVTRVPAAIRSEAMPMEVPGASQLGSLGNQGYAGPCCADHRYEFVLWALNVEKLPDTARRSTAELRQSVLPAHQIATTAPVQMRIGR